MKPIFRLLLLISLTSFLNVQAFQKISLPLTPGITRADIYAAACKQARATLILCPGINGNGQDFLNNPKWLTFAKTEHLNLVGLSFASDEKAPVPGYFDISSGSGQLLLDGIKKAFGPNQPPILLYGFSRGAQFVYGFSKWKPDLVLAWCAYSATEWEIPQIDSSGPKGIIACGEDDESNYSFSLIQFLKGRSMAKPWTWVSLAHTGHSPSPPLEDFVRAYFASVLTHPQDQGLWLDVGTKTTISPDDLKEHPTLAAWLPDETVADIWKNLHQP